MEKEKKWRGIMIANRLILTLFGATGDLASRKLYPAIYRLYKNQLISENFALIGTGRTEWSHDEMRQRVSESICNEVEEQSHLESFLSHIYYLSHDVNDTAHYDRLKQLQEKLDEKYQTQGNRLFYISLSPKLFPVITEHLKHQGLITQQGFNRLIIEKPFGHDVQSAKKLQAQLTNTFDEDQIYRIDHYLGKEMVQAIRNIRFDNQLFKATWNKDYIDNIQISLLEEVGVEDRGEYYDQSGATRDMIQNHALQILALLAMEEPYNNTAEAIQQSKINVLESLVLPDKQALATKFVRAQYQATNDLKGYRQEEKVNPQSQTETYFAAAIELSLPQWEGVPFFIRSGKRLGQKASVIDVQFKATNEEIPGNHLRIDLGSQSGYQLTINQKKLGYSHETESITLDYSYTKEQLEATPQDYERLIYECIIGDKSHFTHYQEVERAWEFVDRVLDYWSQQTSEITFYDAGTIGPREADHLIEAYQREWQLQ